MALLPVNLYVLPFYAELGIPLYAMSILIFCARISDAITDPLMGVITDRTNTRWGRRKPWIVIGTPLLMLSLYKLFLPPDAPTMWYFGTWMVLLYVAYTIIALPYYAWGAEMSDDYEQRTHISGRREQFHFAGNVSFNLLPLLAALAIYLDNSSGDIAQMAANFSNEFQQVMASRGMIGPKGMIHVPSINKQRITTIHSFSINSSSLLLKCHQSAATGMVGISQAMIVLTTTIDWQPRYMKRQTHENSSLESISLAAEARQNTI